MKRKFRLRDDNMPTAMGLSFDKKDLNKVKKALESFECGALAKISEPNRFGIQHVWIDCTGLGSDELKDIRRFIERLKKTIAPEAKEKDSCVKDISSKRGNKVYDSKEDLGWITSPELLEKEDFVDDDAYEFWVKTLEEIAHARTKAQMKNLAYDAIGYLYDDIVNLDVRDEIENDLSKLIWGNDNQLPWLTLGDSKNIKDTDWDFIHQIKNYKYDDIETAMFELFSKKFIKEYFTDKWGDPYFSAMQLATFLDRTKKAKLLKYLEDN